MTQTLPDVQNDIDGVHSEGLDVVIPAGWTPPERYSYSALTSYYQCSWAWYLKRVLHLPETPAVWSAGGNAFHKTTEEFDWMAHETTVGEAAHQGGWQWVFGKEFDHELSKLREKDPDEAGWRTSQKGKVKSRPDGEDIEFWRALGPQLIEKYIRWRMDTDDTWVIAAVEGGPAVEVEVNTLLGGVPVIGYIDRVVEDRKTGVLAIRDYKSGARVKPDPSQVGQYSVQFEQQYGRPVTYGDYYDARHARLSEMLDLTQINAAGLGRKYQALAAAVEAHQFAPNITALCKACGLRKFCRFVGGTEPTPVEVVVDPDHESPA